MKDESVDKEKVDANEPKEVENKENPIDKPKAARKGKKEEKEAPAKRAKTKEKKVEEKAAGKAKEKVKELAKKMLIELGIYYSRARLGTTVSGPIPINVVRPFAIGDDFENVDLEETINNILEKGKKLDHINYDDFFVFDQVTCDNETHVLDLVLT